MKNKFSSGRHKFLMKYHSLHSSAFCVLLSPTLGHFCWCHKNAKRSVKCSTWLLRLRFQNKYSTVSDVHGVPTPLNHISNCTNQLIIPVEIYFKFSPLHVSYKLMRHRMQLIAIIFFSLRKATHVHAFNYKNYVQYEFNQDHLTRQ